MLNNSFSSQISSTANFVKPEDINKISLRTYIPAFSIQIPFFQQSGRNVYIESFSAFDATPNTGSTLEHGRQFLLFCDNARGFHRFNGKQSLLCAISNWDGDSQKQIYSMLNQVPFTVQKGDNVLNFIITEAPFNTEVYPNEAEGQQIPNTQSRFLFNIVLNIIEEN